MKKLYRKRDGAVFAGVLAGLGEYFVVDPVVLRVLFVLLVLITGVVPGVIAYLIAVLIIPPDPSDSARTRTAPPDTESSSHESPSRDASGHEGT